MSAEHVFARADKAAREVDPLMLASALDHIAKTAAKSRTRTRRLRWIEQRATFALEGREYRDIDVDLPKDAGDTAQRMKFERDMLRRANADLLEALKLAVRLLATHVDPASLGGERFDLTDCEDMKPIFAAIAKATGAAQ